MISLTCDSDVIGWMSPPLMLKSKLHAVLLEYVDDGVNDDDVLCRKARRSWIGMLMMLLVA